jgi:hypothetical protein
LAKKPVTSDDCKKPKSSEHKRRNKAHDDNQPDQIDDVVHSNLRPRAFQFAIVCALLWGERLQRCRGSFWLTRAGL